MSRDTDAPRAGPDPVFPREGKGVLPGARWGTRERMSHVTRLPLWRMSQEVDVGQLESRMAA